MRAPLELGVIGNVVRGITKPGEDLVGTVFLHATSTLEYFFLADGFGVGLLLAQQINIVVTGNPEFLQICPGGSGVPGIAVANKDDTGTRKSAYLGDKLLRAGNQSGLLF